jgi:hypothetical protein
MIFDIAVQFVSGFLTNVDWWPSLIKNKEPEDPLAPVLKREHAKVTIVKYPMISFESYVAKHLRIASMIPEESWKAKGLLLLQEFCYDYNDQSKFIEAMVYLMASDTDISNKIKQWMKDNGYEFGEFSPD